MHENSGIKVVFFDARDTLGEVDRPGHLVPYRPSTEKLLAAMSRDVKLKIGVITNLPADVSAEQGRAMVTGAVLSQDPATQKLRTIGDYIDPANVITNHDAGVDKPDPEIYRYA